eukprot:19182_1
MEQDLLLFGYIRQIEIQHHLNVAVVIHGVVRLYLFTYYVLGIGSNENGELGLKHSKPVNTYTILDDIQNIISKSKHIYSSHCAIMLISYENKIYSSGSNSSSKLGLKIINNNYRVSKFTKIREDINNPLLISSGVRNHTCNVIYNKQNELFGLGDINNKKNSFHLMDNYFLYQYNDTIKDIKCGQHHTLFLTTKGLLWSIGSNKYGQCGLHKNIKNAIHPMKIDTSEYKIKAISVGNEFNLLIDTNGSLFAFGDNMYNQCGLKEHCMIYLPQINKYFADNNIKIDKICCGSDYSLCVDYNGVCYSFGDNIYYQCGLYRFMDNCVINKISSDKIVAISSGGYHSLLLNEYNDLIAFGANDYHQCSKIIESKCIRKPYKLNKKDEFGDDKCLIERVIGLNEATIVIINPHQKCL